MRWFHYNFKPMKVLRNPWIELYAASLKSARSFTTNTFSWVHLARGGKIPILGVPGDIRVYAGAFEASVGVLAVVKGHAVNTQHMGLQVTFLRGAVGAVAALEWPLTSLTWERNRQHYHPVHVNKACYTCHTLYIKRIQHSVPDFNQRAQITLVCSI